MYIRLCRNGYTVTLGGGGVLDRPEHWIRVLVARASAVLGCSVFSIRDEQ